MNKAEAEEIVDQVIAELPEGITEALVGVKVYTVEGRTDPELKDAIRNAGLSTARILPDFRGLYLGTTAKLYDDTSGGAVPPLAQGSIVLNAPALTDFLDVRNTLAHEIGHALGMSEAEVEDLGLG